MLIMYAGNARLAKVKGRLSQEQLSRHRSAPLDRAGKMRHVFGALKQFVNLPPEGDLL